MFIAAWAVVITVRAVIEIALGHGQQWWSEIDAVTHSCANESDKPFPLRRVTCFIVQAIKIGGGGKNEQHKFPRMRVGVAL